MDGNKRRRNINYNNLIIFKELIRGVDWNFLYRLEDVNRVYDGILSKLVYCLDEACPFISSKRLPERGNGWITRGIRISCRKKRSLFELRKINNNGSLDNYYKLYCKILKNVIATAKKMNNDCYIARSTNKSKAAWKLIKREEGKKTATLMIDEIKTPNEVLRSPKAIGDYMNQFFVTVANGLSGKKDLKSASNHLSGNNLPISETFVLQPINRRGIIRIIKSLKSSRATGWDGLSNDLLKLIGELVAEPLVFMINLSFRTGIFPFKMKHALVKPVFKKGDRDDVNNYRPITLLPVISKIVEKVVESQFKEFIERKDILFRNQFGFRKGYSTNNAVFRLCEEILRALDQSHHSIAVFCDLSRAFECVDHEILLNKLEYMGVRDLASVWFKSYLSNRSQVVQIVDSSGVVHDSRLSYCTVGVPQGSVLGPLLFLLFVNDMPTSDNMVLYADDTTALVSGRSLDELKVNLSACMKRMTKWFEDNGLSFNAQKSALINFRTEQSNRPDLEQVGNVEEFPATNFLGVIIDEHLSWKQEIESCFKKLSKACYVITMLSRVVNEDTLRMVYYGYFYSILKYSIIFWGHGSSHDGIFRLQKRVMRVMTGSPFAAPCRPLFKRASILPVPCLYIYEILLFVYRNRAIFDTALFQHRYPSRRQVFRLPRHRLAKYEKGVYYRGLKLYNKLPEELKVDNLKNFKKELKAFLLEKCFYSVYEFLND
jgi:hypothetical protein